MYNLIPVLVVALGASPLWADVTVRFDEGAPKDRFVIQNTGPCALADIVVTLDLGASRAGLIFDVTAAGAGVSVFQPLEIVEGRASLSQVPEVRDGDNTLALPIAGLAEGASIAFTIDVDDTAGTQATMVSGAEIEGAKVTVLTAGRSLEGIFGTDAKAIVPLGGCAA